MKNILVKASPVDISLCPLYLDVVPVFTDGAACQVPQGDAGGSIDSLVEGPDGFIPPHSEEVLCTVVLTCHSSLHINSSTILMLQE